MTRFKVGDKVTIETDIKDPTLGMFNGTTGVVIFIYNITAYLPECYEIRRTNNYDLDHFPNYWSSVFLVNSKISNYKVIKII